MMSRKKVLFFSAGAVGGAERMTVNIAKMLPSEDYDVTVVMLGRNFPITNFIPSAIRTIKMRFRPLNFLLIRVWWLMVQERPDVVFASSVGVSPRVIIASRLLGRKTIIRSSGMVGYYPKGDFLKVRLTYPFATLLIAQQEDMRQEMSKLLHIPLSKIVTLNNPLDVEVIEQKRTAASPYPDDGCKHYVNVSRVNPAKGHDIAIKALFELRKREPSAHLYFVGKYNVKDSYYSQLMALAESLKSVDYVHFVGYDDNPYRWVAHADCFVFPSRREGLPNALIEASYLGVPCVATRCLNIISDIVRDGYNGYTAEVDDVEDVALAMERAVVLKDFKMTYLSSQYEDFVKCFREI